MTYPITPRTRDIVRVMTIADYEAMEENCEGLCFECGSLADCVEPDAENYHCDQCGRDAVQGLLAVLFL